MDPSYNNSFGQFGSGAVTNNTGWSQNDIVMSPVAEPKKRFSWKSIVAVAVAVIIVIAALAITKMVIYNQGSSRKEIYTGLWNFYYDASYQDLIEEYSLLDEERSKQNNLDFVLYLSSIDGWVGQIEHGVESSRGSYKILGGLNSARLSGEERKQFDLIKADVGNVLNTIEKNVSMISDFYSKFVKLLNDVNYGDCNRTKDVNAIIDGYMNKDVSEKYFVAYCKIIGFYRNNENVGIMPDDVAGVTQEFIDAFNIIMVNIDDYYNDEIEELLGRIERGANEEN